MRNIAGVNHSRCCAIAEILWSRSRLPEISKFLKIGDGYVIAAMQLYLRNHLVQLEAGDVVEVCDCQLGVEPAKSSVFF